MSEEEKQTELRPTTIVDRDVAVNPDIPKTGDPVRVDGKLTPITRQEVKDVNAHQWDKMSLQQLRAQLDVLDQRLFYATQHGNPEIIKQIELGIYQLRLILQQKTPDEIKLY